MAIAPDPITITVDEEALRKQVRNVIEHEMISFAMRLRGAAHALHPAFADEQHEWQEEEIGRRVKAAIDALGKEEG